MEVDFLGHDCPALAYHPDLLPRGGMKLKAREGGGRLSFPPGANCIPVYLILDG